MASAPKSGAIVPSQNQEIEPADSSKIWFKERMYVEFDAPIVPHKAGREITAEFKSRREEDLSCWCLDSYIETFWATRVVAPALFLFLAPMIVGLFSMTHWLAPISLLVVLGSLASAAAFGNKISSHARQKLLKGRYSEAEQLNSAQEQLLMAANGVEVFDGDKVCLPVEALFRGLAHVDSEVRQMSADLIAKMPAEARQLALEYYYSYLTAAQIEKICGQPLPKECAAAHDKQWNNWGNSVAIDFSPE